MKILIIHNSGSLHLPSGELKVAENEHRAIRDSNVECNLYVFYNDKIEDCNLSKLVNAGINIFWSHSSYILVSKLLEKHKPDIIHFHGVLPLLTASSFYACKKKNVPVVQTLHNFRWVCVEGGLYRDNRYCEICIHSSGWQGVVYGCSRGSRAISLPLFINNLLYRKSGFLYSWVDKFIAVSEFLKNNYVNAGFPDNKIIVKYNGITTLPEAHSVTNSSGRQGITYVGRLAPAKGTKILKEIVKQINIPFNIVGSGPDLCELKEYCRLHKLHHVKFWGQINNEDCLRVIMNSKCIVIPSLCGEAFPLTAVESIACGTPVVASSIGGVKEIVDKSGCGITVDPDDVRTFVSAIKEIINSSEKIRQMGASGKAYTEKHLTLKHSIHQLLDIYRNVIDENRRKK